MDLRIGEISAHQLDPPGRISGKDVGDTVEGGKMFTQFLNEAVSKVSSAEKAADAMTIAFATGEPVEVHDVMLALSKANMTMLMFIEIRNKVIEAYQEITRMPV